METPDDGMQRLLDEAPFVHLLARALIADEADEVVQRTWLRAIRHGAARVVSPRAWLARVVHSVASNLRRGRDLRRRHEQAVRPEQLVPSSAELMQQEEQRRLLIAAVDRLPSSLRAVVLLRYFDGLLPQAIAVRLDVPVTTVWNQLRRALQLLRERLDGEHGGDRRAWLVPLVPLAARRGLAPAGQAATTAAGAAMVGIRAMAMKTKLVAALTVGVVLVAWVIWMGREPGPSAGVPAGSGREEVAAVSAPTPQPVVARAVGFAPWRGSVETAPLRTGAIRIVLEVGGVVRGRVVDAQGEPLAQAEVRVGDWQELSHCRALATADGAFELVGLPVGEVKLSAQHAEAGRGELTVQTVAGTATACELRLSRGSVLRGRVVDSAGEPVALALLAGTDPGDGSPWHAASRTAADGSFVLSNCPHGRSFRLQVEAEGFEPLARTAVAVESPLELVLQRVPDAATVRIRGVVHAADGTPMAGVRVQVSGPTPASRGRTAATDASGHFQLGPLPAGRWSIVMVAAEYPRYVSRPVELAPHAMHDLGVIQLVAGGLAKLVLEGDRQGVKIRVIDAQGRGIGLPIEPIGAVVTPKLVPGAYHLLVSGQTTAAMSIPFAIEAGEMASVPVKLAPGVRQRFELNTHALDPRLDRALLEVRRGNDVLIRSSVALLPDRPAAVDLCLPIGAWAAVVLGQGRELGRATFRVDAGDGLPVRITLQ